MVAIQSPTSFLLKLPLGDCSECFSNPVLDQASGQDVVGPSVVSLRVSPRPDLPGHSLIPFASLLGLGAELPHVRSLHLRSMLLQLDASPCNVPRFSLLESLLIDPWFSNPPRVKGITTSLIALFPHMPRLRNLTVYASMARPGVDDADQDLQYPHPPFSLERLVCFGTLSVRFCAHLIAQSRRTLHELRIHIVGHADADEAALLAAVAQAALHLRVLDLRLRGDSRLLLRVAPVFAALARVDTLHIETPQNVPLQDVLAFITGAHTRTLSVRSPRDRHDSGASVDMQRVLALLHTHRCLQNLTLMDFEVSLEDAPALVAHCRARRIRCSTYMY